MECLSAVRLAQSELVIGMVTFSVVIIKFLHYAENCSVNLGGNIETKVGRGQGSEVTLTLYHRMEKEHIVLSISQVAVRYRSIWFVKITLKLLEVKC